MKILFVQTYCPNRIAAGAERRTARYIDYFQKKGTVDLLTLTSPGEHADTPYIQKNFNQHYYFDQQKDHPRLGKLEQLLHLVPWQLSQYYSKVFQENLNGIIENNQYDLIFVFKLEPAFYFLKLPSRWKDRIVIDFDDILSDVYLNYYKNYFTSLKNSFFLKLYEDKALKEFKRAFVCSSNVVGQFPAKLQDKVGIIPNVFTADPKQFIPTAGPPNKVLFAGSLDYFPNIEGLQWFCSHIWPQFLKEYPGSALTIIGKIKKDAQYVMTLLGNPKNTQVSVNVPDVSPYYKDCSVTIVPLLNGSGTRLKILESASFGRPVITTAKGMEGLDFAPGKDILTFKDAASFISAYKALEAKEKYAEVTQNALAVLKEKYSPDVFLSRMNENWPKIHTN